MSDELVLVQNLIHEIRGKKVMLDFDLTRLYHVETKALNQAVKRNIKRFPPDFMFQLSFEEVLNMRSQFVTSSKRHTSDPPFAFTEQGIAMLSGVLKSDIAIAANSRHLDKMIHDYSPPARMATEVRPCCSPAT